MSNVLDLAIGLSFLYLLLALLVTTVQELIASVLELRGKNLHDALEGVLVGEAKAGGPAPLNLLEKVYDHPLIKNLQGKPWLRSKLRLPSYIPSKTFAVALLDVLRGDNENAKLLAGASVALGKLEGHDDLKRTLQLVFEHAQSATNDAEEQLALVTAGIEDWFNDRMARASGWYKRKAHIVGLVLAFVVAGLSNSDSIHVVQQLWRDGALRDAIAASAQTYYGQHQAQPAGAASNSTPAAPAASSPATTEHSSPAPVGSVVPPEGSDSSVSDASQNMAAAVNQLQTAKLPIGWSSGWRTSRLGWLLRVLGWIITALAASLGAGFWFDALGKALGLRKTGLKVSAATGRAEDQE